MTRWYVEKKREHYYKQAKKQGYRARSSYKLKQIQKKYHLISKGDYVLDLGAAPGGWSQVAKEFCGVEGKIIGIDLLPIIPIDDVVFLRGDITEDASIQQIKDVLDGHLPQVVLSDMAPNISGNYSVDHAQSIYLSMCALNLAKDLLISHGHFVCKVFMGESFEELLQMVKELFQTVYCFSPPASRKSSSEIYIIGKLYNKEY